MDDYHQNCDDEGDVEMRHFSVLSSTVEKE
jgi:hypothetical protein